MSDTYFKISNIYGNQIKLKSDRFVHEPSGDSAAKQALCALKHLSF